MSWAQPKYISCRGFDKRILPILQAAIDNHEIVWQQNTVRLFIDQCTGNFEFANCVWQLEEIREVVVSISRLSGVIHQPDLTAVALKYKIETS